MKQPDKADEFAYYWRLLAPVGAPQPEREYQFMEGRKFRADFAWIQPQYKLIVEIDGGNMMTRISPRTGKPVVVGRHNQDSDHAKCNLAVQHGWKVLHYTPAMLLRHPGAVIDQVCMTLANGREA